MCQGLNSHYFHIIGDKLINPTSRGLYTHYKDSVIKGGMTIPNIATFDHGTYKKFLLSNSVLSLVELVLVNVAQKFSRDETDERIYELGGAFIFFNFHPYLGK